MKKFALMAVLLAAVAGPASAQHSIGIYEDAEALNCEITDPGSALKTIYIVHTNELIGAIGSRWRLLWDPGMTMTYVGDDATPFYKVGDAQTGAQVSYTQCTTGTFKIDAVTFLSNGTSSPCSYFRLGPDAADVLTIVDCGFRYLPFVPGEAIVNADGSCACTVSTGPTSWGTIKAMYR